MMLLVARRASFLQTSRARVENHPAKPPLAVVAKAARCTRAELYPSPPTGKHTRSSAPAQNCFQAHQLVSTPVQVHPLRTVSTVSKPTNWQAHPFNRSRSELYPSPPTGKHTRSIAPAQNCIQAHQLVSTPAQVHPLRTVSKPTHTRSSAPAQNRIQAGKHTRSRSELHPSPPTGKHTRSSTPAHQLASTPAQVHPLRTVSKPTNW